MSALLAQVLLVVVVFVLSAFILAANEEPQADARTPEEMWASVQALGWKVTAVRTVGALLTLVALIAGSFAILTALLLWHACDLGEHHPVTIMEARS